MVDKNLRLHGISAVVLLAIIFSHSASAKSSIPRYRPTALQSAQSRTRELKKEVEYYQRKLAQIKGVKNQRSQSVQANKTTSHTEVIQTGQSGGSVHSQEVANESPENGNSAAAHKLAEAMVHAANARPGE